MLGINQGRIWALLYYVMKWTVLNLSELYKSIVRMTTCSFSLSKFIDILFYN